MKATGIVRRIDDLGRVVIPKEIRRTLRIQDGESLEIYTGTAGEIILKKYSPMENIEDYAIKYGKVMWETLGKGIIITDTDSVIASNGLGVKLDHGSIQIQPQYIQLLVKRKQIYVEKGSKEFKELYGSWPENFEGVLITPIIKDGDIIGGIVVIQVESKGKVSEVDYALSQMGANYLASQM